MRFLRWALPLVLACGCSGRAEYMSVDGVMLGTTLRIVADARGTSPAEVYAAAMELDREAKASMSIFDPESLLSRLNRNETDSVDRHIAFNLRLADSIGRLSGGRYDVTIAWRRWSRRGASPAGSGRAIPTSIRCSPSSGATRSASPAAGW